MPWFSSTPRQIPVDCFFCLSPSYLDPKPPSSTPSSNSALGSGGSGIRLRNGRQVDRDATGYSLPGGEEGTRWNWQCPKCHCWNVRDKRGEMISDHAAMHDATLNQGSYALRAQQSTAHIPTGRPAIDGPFCHDCLTNQTMIISLLANYLPSEDDPTYKALHDDLDSYVTSLHHRFPPVCPKCRPRVDEALRKADQKAHNAVWSMALKRGQERTRVDRELGIDDWAVGVWKLRGVLFCLSIVLSLGQGVMAVLSPALLSASIDTRFLGLSGSRALAVFHVVSLFWIVWDPYWLSKVRSDGRLKLTGRDVWVRDLLLIYVLRLFSLVTINGAHGFRWTSRGLTIAEACLLVHALTHLKIQRPVALKLVRPSGVSLPATPVRNESSEAYHFNHLNLDGIQPGPSPLRHSQSNPIFGRVSFPEMTSRTSFQTDNMDWEPTPNLFETQRRVRSNDDVEDDDPGMFAQARKMNWDTFGVGLQRIFPKAETQATTGLETLFGSRDLLNDPVEKMDGVELNGAARSSGIPSDLTSNIHGANRPPGIPSPTRDALILDSTLVRRSMLGFTLLRLLGALVALLTYHTNPNLYDLLFIDSGASRMITNLELGANVLDVIISLNTGSSAMNEMNAPTNARMILVCLFLIVRGASKMVSGRGLVALGVGWTVELPRWAGIAEWVGWGCVDFVCAVAM